MSPNLKELVAIKSELKDARISILRVLQIISYGDHISILANDLNEADRLLERAISILGEKNV